MADESAAQVDAGTPRGIDPALAPLLAAVRRLSTHAVEMADHMRAASDVNDTDFRALTHIQSDPGITAGELGHLLQRSPGAVSTVLDRLEEAGHLERRRDDDDRRRVTLWVTDRPRRVAMATLAPFMERMAAEFADDAPEELAALAAELSRVAHVMEQFLVDQRAASP